MVASPTQLKTNAGAPVLEMASQMEQLAAKGDWSRTELLVTRLRSALLEIPASERQSLMTVVRKSVERVQTIALTSRIEVADKISGIRRGRVATRAYGQPGTASAPVLR